MNISGAVIRQGGFAGICDNRSAALRIHEDAPLGWQGLYILVVIDHSHEELQSLGCMPGLTTTLKINYSVVPRLPPDPHRPLYLPNPPRPRRLLAQVFSRHLPSQMHAHVVQRMLVFQCRLALTYPSLAALNLWSKSSIESLFGQDERQEGNDEDVDEDGPGA